MHIIVKETIRIDHQLTFKLWNFHCQFAIFLVDFQFQVNKTFERDNKRVHRQNLTGASLSENQIFNFIWPN